MTSVFGLLYTLGAHTKTLIMMQICVSFTALKGGDGSYSGATQRLLIKTEADITLHKNIRTVSMKGFGSELKHDMLHHSWFPQTSHKHEVLASPFFTTQKLIGVAARLQAASRSSRRASGTANPSGTDCVPRLFLQHSDPDTEKNTIRCLSA